MAKKPATKKTASKPAPKKAVKPVAKTATKPAPKAAPKKASKPAPKAAPKKASKPAPKAAPKKASKPASKAAPKKVSKPAPKAAPKKVSKPAPKVAPKKASKPAPKAAPKKVTKPAPKASPKPAVKAAVKVAPKPAAKVVAPKAAPAKVVKAAPVVKSVVRPVEKKMEPIPELNLPKRKNVGPTPIKRSTVDITRTRYSDQELKEFKTLISDKLEKARAELKQIQSNITKEDENGTADTENRFGGMEDGAGTLEREYLNQMATRLGTYIGHLEKALMRIENKTYGICRVTGKLIAKERLLAVPHATLSLEAKELQN